MARQRTNRRSKSSFTAGDKLHQSYRNRAAMFRVYQAAQSWTPGTVVPAYWTPLHIDDYVNVKGGE